MPYKLTRPFRFLYFASMNFCCLMISNVLKRIIYYSFWNNRIQSKYLWIKFICVQQVHQQSKLMRSDVC